MSLNIIGLGGPDGVGKSTTAALLGSKLGFMSYPLSLPLRRLCAAVYGQGGVFLEKWEESKDRYWDALGCGFTFPPYACGDLTPRDTVLRMGANGVLGHTLCKGSLCAATFSAITLDHKKTLKSCLPRKVSFNACVPDIRYPFELDFWEATRDLDHESYWDMFWLHREAATAMPDWMVGRATPVDISCSIQMTRFITHVRGLIS